MERNENDDNRYEGKREDKFLLEYPENYNEIVEGMLRRVERECEYIKKFEIKGKSKESLKLKEGDVNSNNDNNDEEDDEDSDNDTNQYIALNDENDDYNNIHSNNNNNDNEQQPLTNNSYEHNNNINTNITSPPLSQHITHIPPSHNSTQPNINSSKIKQMLSKVNIPAPSWASSLSDEAFLNLILPSLNQ